jgi:hypothetical protein
MADTDPARFAVLGAAEAAADELAAADAGWTEESEPERCIVFTLESALAPVLAGAP